MSFLSYTGATVAVLVFSPVGKPFTFSSDGNFDETVGSFHRDELPESTSQSFGSETDLSSTDDLDGLQANKDALLTLRECLLERIQLLQKVPFSVQSQPQLQLKRI